jgi:hypothetical protein
MNPSTLPPGLIEALPDDERRVLLLRDIAEMTAPETAYSRGLSLEAANRFAIALSAGGYFAGET